MFLFNKYLLSTCYELGTGPENGNMAVSKFNVIACPNGVGNDAATIKLPQIEDPDSVRQKEAVLLFYFLLVWALLGLELIDFSYESCWRESAFLRGIDSPANISLV